MAARCLNTAAPAPPALALTLGIVSSTSPAVSMSPRSTSVLYSTTDSSRVYGMTEKSLSIRYTRDWEAR
jgi:hypothetical protein